MTDKPDVAELLAQAHEILRPIFEKPVYVNKNGVVSKVNHISCKFNRDDGCVCEHAYGTFRVASFNPDNLSRLIAEREAKVKQAEIARLEAEIAKLRGEN